MKRNLYLCSLLLLFILLSVEASAQDVRISARGNTNISLIKEINHPGNNGSQYPSSGYYSYYVTPSYKEKFENQVGGNLMGNIEFSVGSNFYIKTGLGLNLIRFKRKIEMEKNSYSYETLGEPGVYNLSNWSDSLFFRPIVVSGNSENPDSKFGQTNLLYLDIPIMAGYSFLKNRLNIRVGITTSLLAYSEVYENPYLGIVNRGTEKNTSSDGINNMMLSSNTEVSYRVWKNISLTASYNRQFNNIYDSGSDAKNQTVGLGLEFRFAPKPVLGVQ